MAAPGRSQAGIHSARNLHESSAHRPVSGVSHAKPPPIRATIGRGVCMETGTTHSSKIDSTRGNMSWGLGTRTCCRFHSKSNMHTCQSACNTRAAALSDRRIGNNWPGLRVDRHHRRRKWLACVWRMELDLAPRRKPGSMVARRTTKPIDCRVFERYPAQRTALVAQARALVRVFQAF